MVAPVIEVTAAAAPDAPAAAKAGTAGGPSFHEVLSALNPLQYLPVVGTIYRAVTGDTVPEPLRRLGSFLVSGLLGGPIGLAINAGTTLLEKLSGIDLDTIGQSLLGHAEAAAPASSAAPPTSNAAPASASVAAVGISPARVAWTAQQLAAYGVRTDAAGSVSVADVTGADVFNSMELTRLGKAIGAYAASLAIPAASAAAPRP